MTDSKDTPPEPPIVSINHIIGDDLKTQFSNHMAIQHTPEGEFYITFFETIQPLFFGSGEDLVRQHEQLEKIDSHCLARYVVSHERIPAFIAALGKSYANFVAAKENPTADKGDRDAG